MAVRSIESRLQRLEGTDRLGGKFIVISCGGTGNTQDAEAYFEELTGEPIALRDTLVVMHTIQTRDPSELRTSEPPTYKLLTHLDARGVDGRTRGLLA